MTFELQQLRLVPFFPVPFFPWRDLSSEMVSTPPSQTGATQRVEWEMQPQKGSLHRQFDLAWSFGGGGWGVVEIVWNWRHAWMFEQVTRVFVDGQLGQVIATS